MQLSEWELRIHDMLNAIVEIHSFVDRLSFPDFRSDLRTLRAVEYNFVVLGEAARAIPVEVQALNPLVPWPLIIGMRNLVAHQYRRVDPAVLWDTVQNDLPPLVPLLRQVLQHGV